MCPLAEGDEMERSPRVTVLMAVYNGERYLREAIDSILGQTFADFEFLIVDDASMDGSARIIEEYADQRIRLVRNEVNRGLAVSLNRGLDMGRGEYVARMDGDDVSLPERLEKQVAFLDSHPEVGVCGTWVRYLGEGAGKVVRYPTDPEIIRAGLLFYPLVAHPSVMLRRESFVRHGLRYDPALRRSQDYELWSRAARHLLFSNLPEVHLLYRLHPAQAGIADRTEQQGTAERVRRTLLFALGIDPTDEEWQIHQALALCRIGRDRTLFRRADRWLCRLTAANRATRSFEETAFTRMLVERWVTFIKKGIEETGAWQELLHLPSFIGKSGLGWWHAAGFLLREVSVRLGASAKGVGGK